MILSFMWLFMLSYTTAVINSEYRELTREIKKYECEYLSPPSIVLLYVAVVIGQIDQLNEFRTLSMK